MLLIDPNLHLVNPRIVNKRLKAVPVVGSVHGCELPNVFGPGELTDYLIHFATHLDPNGGSSPRWPQYTIESPQVMTLNPFWGTNITQDTYRSGAIDYATYISLTYPF
jgi:acetylcholinesterase